MNRNKNTRQLHGHNLEGDEILIRAAIESKDHKKLRGFISELHDKTMPLEVLDILPDDFLNKLIEFFIEGVDSAFENYSLLSDEIFEHVEKQNNLFFRNNFFSYIKLAISHDMPDKVNYLLDRKKLDDHDLEVILSLSVEKQAANFISSLLLKHCISDPNFIHNGVSLLHVLIQKLKKDEIDILLAMGANPTAASKLYGNPLAHAMCMKLANRFNSDKITCDVIIQSLQTSINMSESKNLSLQIDELREQVTLLQKQITVLDAKMTQSHEQVPQKEKESAMVNKFSWMSNNVSSKRL